MLLQRSPGIASVMGIKPTTQTPYSGIAWGVLCEDVGIPKGVVSIVKGFASEIGNELYGNPLVRKITFTESILVGMVLLKKTADTVKKVSRGLGGNVPFLVFDDAGIELAVEGAINTNFRNSGQTCVCTNRFLVQKGTYDNFVARLSERVKQLKVGNGQDEDVPQGPLIDEKAIAPIYQFENEEDTIKMANDNEYGLACYFHTASLGHSFRVMDALQYGMVWWIIMEG